jgi:lysine/ornithine N-monooxygenase
MYHISRLTEASRAVSAAGLSSRDLNFVVVGSGQSAAEIFDDLWNRFSEAKVTLVIRGAALRPSDDSPL